MTRLTRRSSDDIRRMRVAGRVVAEMHEAMRAALRPGVTTGDLDRIGRAVLERRGATSNFLGYHGYPAVICASVNDEVIHGIPGERVLHEGDVVGIDCGAVVDGWHGDAAFSAGVGTISPEAEQLIAVAERSLVAAIEQMQVGRRLGDVSHAVQRVAEAAGAGIVDGYCGHGIGRAMHEEPDVPNTGKAGRGPKLAAGVVLAIEPMLTLGGPDTRTLDDHWTVVTADGSLAVHVEHTVAVTADGPQILTAT
ncbi:MAG: type I methionyl aminopeptidase [Acidimicrobiia bacterium]